MTIQSIFDSSSNDTIKRCYEEMIRDALNRIFEGFSELPQLRWEVDEKHQLSVFLLCRSRPNVGKFFYEMVNRWLLPGKKLNISLFFTSDFRLPDDDEGLLALSHLVISPESQREGEIILNQLMMIEQEIKLGAQSVYHATRILEIKGLSSDEKTALIQDRIARFVRRKPLDFEYDVFGEMQHFFVRCRGPFKAIREYEHLAKMVCLFYLFRKDLAHEVEESSDRRHVRLKLIPVQLHMPLGIKKVLGVCVGLNLVNENEMFEERHLLKAVQNCLQGVKLVEGSFFMHATREDEIRTLYIEVETDREEPLTFNEVKKLGIELPDALKACVEQRMRPLFMPRNEEEVMRNILTLSHQLKYLRDIPQVILTFEEQKEGDLLFTVILLRVLSPESLAIQSLFSPSRTGLHFTPERVRKVGVIRKKYPKEASVLRVRLAASEFIRADHTVDLYKARQAVIAELERILGEVRDYNGGMISKQIESFVNLKGALGPMGIQHDLLLENFFHSISPVEMRSLLPTEPLKNLFLMLLKAVDQKKGGRGSILFDVQQEPSRACLMFAFQDSQLKHRMSERAEQLHFPMARMITVSIKVLDVFYLGFLLLSEESSQQNLFIETLTRDV
jgi:hypothetical protein